MTTRVAVGVAGLGRMGAIHARNLAFFVPAARLARVVDEDRARARTAGEELDVPWSASFDDLLADAAVEAVVIATPTPLHGAMTERAATAGKHVYCEKPLALDLPSTVRAVEEARRADVLLQIGFHRRFDPDLALLHDRIRSGELGEVRLFHASFREPTPPDGAYLRRCGGIFADMTIHDLDLARWLVGEIAEITATTAHPVNGAEDDGLSAALTLRFAKGALGIIQNTRLAGYGYEATTELVGSRATARTGHAQGRSDVDRLADGHATHDIHVDFHERFGDAYRLGLAGFLDAILATRPATPSGQDATLAARPATPSGQDAIAALQLAHAAARSAAERRTVRLAPTAAKAA